jgi:hypothetical protein
MKGRCNCLFENNNLPHPGIEFDEENKLRAKTQKYNDKLLANWKQANDKQLERWFREFVESGDLCGNYFDFETDETELEEAALLVMDSKKFCRRLKVVFGYYPDEKEQVLKSLKYVETDLSGAYMCLTEMEVLKDLAEKNHTEIDKLFDKYVLVHTDDYRMNLLIEYSHAIGYRNKKIKV